MIITNYQHQKTAIALISCLYLCKIGDVRELLFLVSAVWFTEVHL